MAATLRPGEEKLFEGQPKGFPFGDFDVADVMLPEDDDMGIISEDEDEEEEIETESGFGSIVGEDCIDCCRCLFPSQHSKQEQPSLLP